MYEITVKVYIPGSAGEYETQKHKVKDLEDLMNLMSELNPEQGAYEDDDTVFINAIKKIEQS